MKLVRKGYLFVPKTYFDESVLEQDLIHSVFDPFERKKNELKFFYDLDDHYLVPPYYMSNEHIQDKHNQGKDINLDMFFDFRTEEQKDAVEFLKSTHSGILKAPPGFGKTYCAIRSIQELGKSALIVVDSEKLRNQWIESIKKFTGLSENDVGIIAGRESLKADLKRKPIVIAMIQTLASLTRESIFPEEYMRFFNECNFGISIIDEMHKILGTPHFSRAFVFMLSRYIWGLSATPRKNDEKLTSIVRMYFEKYFDPQASKRQPLHVIQLHFKSNLTQRTLRYIKWNKFFDVKRYIKQVLKKPEFFDMVEFAYSNLVEKQKNILTIGHTIELLEKTKSDLISKDIMDKNQIGTVISGSDSSELVKDHIFSTYQMCTAGLSLDHMNSLVLLSPVADNPVTLEQVTGRVTRDHTSDNVSYVIDPVDDTYKHLIKWANKRKKIYEDLGFQVTDFNLQEP